jgi:hypothetical protein
MLSSSPYPELLMAHTMSRISDPLVSLLGKPCKFYSFRSGRSFLYYQTGIAGFTEDYA